LIGAVEASGWEWCAAGEIATASERLAWLVTIKITGPAPTAWGETAMRE
jgi:hypothetical protein